MFDYNAASDTFTPGTTAGTPPQGNDAKCGFACHTRREGERLRVHGVREAVNHNQEEIVDLETLRVRQEGAVLFADISAPPMNLLGTELVRDLVSLIQRAEADDACHVLVFTSADPDYFISHVDVTRIKEYREQAAKLTGEPSIGHPVSLSERKPARHHRTDRGSRARRR